MSISYNIIATGSQGNAVIINDIILIDCGVSYKAIEPYMGKLRLVLLTHIHSDHFKPATIRTLARERPTLRFGCCWWLAGAVVDCGVEKRNIDIYEWDTSYGYGICDIIPVPLVHNVPNCGYKIHFREGTKMVYATDTNNLNGIVAKDYDLYMIEANYDEDEIKERIKLKKEAGAYPYELAVLKNHLSKDRCNDFIYRNIGVNGVYVYMHCHRDEEQGDDNNS